MNTDLSFQCSKKWIIKPRKKKKSWKIKLSLILALTLCHPFVTVFYIYNDIIESRFIHQ